MWLIDLTQKQNTIVDDADWNLVKGIKWYAWFNPSTKSYYAVFSQQRDGKKKTIYLHRLLMGNPIGKVVDHKNHDTLDNRRENLRICTQQDNVRAGKGKVGKSGYKGVFWNKERKKWQGKIYDGKKSVHLGMFKTKTAAARAYNEAAKKIFGEFNYLNKI